MSDMYMCVKNWKGYRKGKLYECVDYNNGLNIYDDFGKLGLFHTYGTIRSDEAVQCPVMYDGEYVSEDIHGCLEVFRNEDYKIKDWMVLQVYFKGDIAPMQFKEECWHWTVKVGGYFIKSKIDNSNYYIPTSSIKFVREIEVSE